MKKNIRSYLLFSVQPSKGLLITLLLGCWSLMVTANDVSVPTPIENSQLTMQLSAQEAALIQLLRTQPRNEPTVQQQTANTAAMIDSQAPITLDAMLEAAQEVLQMLPNVNQKFSALNNEGVTPERWHEALSAYEEFLTIVADHSRYTQGDGKAPKRVESNDEGQQKGTITPVGAN